MSSRHKWFKSESVFLLQGLGNRTLVSRKMEADPEGQREKPGA